MATSKDYMLLLMLACFWGPSFLFLKIAVVEIPPVTIACIRSVAAALILLVVVKKRGITFPANRSIYVHFIFIGLFSMALPFSLITWSELYIDSAMASVLNATMPLYTVLLAHFTLSTERMNGTRLIGLFIGFAGVIMILLPSLAHDRASWSWGLLAASIAALSYAIGAVYAKQKMKGQPPILATSLQLSSSAILLIPAMIIIEDPLGSLKVIHFKSVLAISYLSIVGTALAFYFYYKIMDRAGASFVSNVTYLMPVFGILLGYIFLGEKLSKMSLAGALLILIGIAVSGGLLTRVILRIRGFSSCSEHGV